MSSRQKQINNTGWLANACSLTFDLISISSLQCLFYFSFAGTYVFAWNWFLALFVGWTWMLSRRGVWIDCRRLQQFGGFYRAESPETKIGLVETSSERSRSKGQPRESQRPTALCRAKGLSRKKDFNRDMQHILDRNTHKTMLTICGCKLIIQSDWSRDTPLIVSNLTNVNYQTLNSDFWCRLSRFKYSFSVAQGHKRKFKFELNFAMAMNCTRANECDSSKSGLYDDKWRFVHKCSTLKKLPLICLFNGSQ